MLEKIKTDYGNQFVAVARQMARLIAKNDYVPEDLVKIKKATGHLEKAELVLKTIEDDRNADSN